MNNETRLERDVAAPPERVWELWTTAAGIEQWWSPDGFRTDVERLDLIVGGQLVHTMTADHPDTIAFVKDNGLPLSTTAHKTFVEIVPPTRLAYESLVDFVPAHEPYQHLTVVDLEAVPDGTHITMTVHPMHDEEWTGRMVAGRTNELDNLAHLVTAGSP